MLLAVEFLRVRLPFVVCIKAEANIPFIEFSVRSPVARVEALDIVKMPEPLLLTVILPLPENAPIVAVVPLLVIVLPVAPDTEPVGPAARLNAPASLVTVSKPPALRLPV